MSFTEGGGMSGGGGMTKDDEGSLGGGISSWGNILGDAGVALKGVKGYP